MMVGVRSVGWLISGAYCSGSDLRHLATAACCPWPRSSFFLPSPSSFTPAPASLGSLSSGRLPMKRAAVSPGRSSISPAEAAGRKRAGARGEGVTGGMRLSRCGAAASGGVRPSRGASYVLHAPFTCTALTSADNGVLQAAVHGQGQGAVQLALHDLSGMKRE